MNQELLTILDSIERDKGVKKDILIKAIESALISAARKKLGKHIMDIKVQFDQETGDFKVFGPDGEELSGDFGRISAQTAKQVIIQKIREAETEWIPYVVVVGQKELDSGVLAVRDRSLFGTGKKKEIRKMSLKELVNEIIEETKGKPFKPLPLPVELSKRPRFYG